MTTTGCLRELAKQSLVDHTDARFRVYSPLDQATWDGEYPVVFTTIDDEHGESFGPNGAPTFTVTATLRVEARAQAPAQANDQGAAALRLMLERLRDQIKAAVINAPGFLGPLGPLQQFSAFRSTFVPGPDASQHIGSVVVEIDLEFIQGAHEFYPVYGSALQGVDLAVQEPAGTVEPGFSITFPTPS